MTTYLDASFDKRLSRIEEQIKQFKNTQNYGMNQVQTYSAGSLTANSVLRSFQEEGVTWWMQTIRKKLLFTGIYPNATAICRLHLIEYLPSDWDIRDVWYYTTDNPNEFVIEYTCVGDTAPDSEPRPPAFSETMEVWANMPGTIRVSDL